MCSISCYRFSMTAESPILSGRTVDFKNTIIILTSNLGSSYILDGINDKGEISEEAKNEVNKLLKNAVQARIPQPS